jgi:outer membrane protein
MIGVPRERAVRCALALRPAALVVLAAIVLSPTLARGQVMNLPGAEALKIPDAAPTPPKLTQPTLSLADAVRLTVLHNAQLSQARQDVASGSGLLVQARGQFDSLFGVGAGYTHTHEPLTPALRQREQDRRTELQIIASTFGDINKQMLAVLKSLSPRPPRCPIGVDLTNHDILTDRVDPLQLTMLGTTRDIRVTFQSQDLTNLLGVFNTPSVCASPTDPTGAPTGAFSSVWQAVDAITHAGLNEASVQLLQIPQEQTALAAALSDTIATRAQLTLDRFGPVPTAEVRKSLDFEASYMKPFRNGLTTTVDIHLESDYDNFAGKTLDVAYGALGQPIQFPSFAALGFIVPLGKGRGRPTVTAQERAAEITLRAQTDRLRHAASEQVFQTVLAYLNLVAAQQREQLIDQSVARQKQLAQVTGRLVTAEEVPKTELDKAAAHEARVESDLRAARLDVTSARFGLADTIGLDVDSMANAPLAAEAFATSLAPVPDTNSAIQAALATRRDRLALQAVRDASQVLATAASLNQKRQIDLSIDAGMDTFVESAPVHFLPDEQNPIFSQLNPPGPVDPAPINYVSPTGFFRSLVHGKWRPFLAAGLTFDVPFLNLTARGQSHQADASLQSSRIEAEDLDRVIRENVISVTGALKLARDTVERRRAAVDFLQQTLDSAMKRYQAREITLIDALTTEENLTLEQLQLVQDLNLYFSTLARLRFETGTLAFFDQANTDNEVVRFDPTALVGR